MYIHPTSFFYFCVWGSVKLVFRDMSPVFASMYLVFGWFLSDPYGGSDLDFGHRTWAPYRVQCPCLKCQHQLRWILLTFPSVNMGTLSKTVRFSLHPSQWVYIIRCIFCRFLLSVKFYGEAAGVETFKG